MNIKLSLKQLVALFARSASNEELPVPIRQFAAQLTVLCAHVERTEGRINSLDSAIAELATMMGALPDKVAETLRQGSAPAVAPAPAVKPDAETNDLSEDDEATAMAAKVLQETEAEVAVIAARPSVPAITPIRKANGNKATVEDAS